MEVIDGWNLNWVKQTRTCAGKQTGTWIALAHQDNGATLFGWWSMVALLSLWEHTGIERLQIKHRNEIYSDIFKLKHK